MIVALYARVSTDRQDEQLQLPRLREFAARKGYEVFREYSDKASGRNGDRPGWKALLSDSRRGEFDAVVVTKLDRIMRSLSNTLEIFSSFQAIGVEIITLDQGPLNLNGGASARLQLRLLAMLAEWEAEIIAQRTREGLEARRALGVKLGRPKREFPVHTIALMRLEGKSWSSIAELTGVPRTTINSRKKEILEEMEEIGVPEEREIK